MKISLMILANIMLINVSAMAHPITLDDLRVKPILINNSHILTDNFSVHGVQTHYWLENSSGEIPMTVTTLDHLLITTYLYDQYDDEKTQTATLIDNRSKNMTLFLVNLPPGNYRLVVTGLATDHQISSKTFHMTLANQTTGYDSIY